MQEPYNVSQEMERKRAQSLILSQTKQQERRDEEVFTLSPFNYTFRENEVNIGINYWYYMQVLAEAKRIAELRIMTKVIFNGCIRMTLIITCGEEEEGFL